MLRGLSSKSATAVEVADKIYSYYEEVFENFEAIARTAGKMKNLLLDIKTSKNGFFQGEGFPSDKVYWWIDKGAKNMFEPTLKKGSRRINPLFNKEQIITKNKWKKMQEAIDNHEYPSVELLELLRIRSKLEWRQNKIATIESAILIETVLRDYGNQVLQTLGLSNNKLKSMRDEMSFNTVLNIVLPLSLTKTELKRVERHLVSVDLLRKVRNDVVHGNISEDEINVKNVRNSIEGALVLVEVLRKKLKAKSP